MKRRKRLKDGDADDEENFERDTKTLLYEKSRLKTFVRKLRTERTDAGAWITWYTESSLLAWKTSSLDV